MMPEILKSADLVFDEKEHKYFFGGKELPSVTTILKTENFFDTRWFTEESRIRGSIVHKATELLDLGQLDWFSLQPEIERYVLGWEKFRKRENFECDPSHVEMRVHQKAFGYVGTVDRFCKLDGKLTLLDLKTGPKNPWWILQIVGYLEAITEMTQGELSFHNVQCCCIQLKKNEDYKIHLYQIEDLYEAKEIFLSALNVFKWKHVQKIYNDKNEFISLNEKED